MNIKFTKELGITVLISAIIFGMIGFFAGKYTQKQEMMKNFQNRAERFNQNGEFQRERNR